MTGETRLIEIYSDSSVVDWLELAEAVTVVKHKIEDHRTHLANLDDMFNNIKFNVKDLELFVEENDPIA